MSRTMTGALKAALAYAARGSPVFPCHWEGERRKNPLTERGFHDATTGLAVITEWWLRWPDALIGTPTGRCIGAVVLDVDVKRLDANGFDSLADLGYEIFPVTPMVHTASGGLHLYFELPTHLEIRNTTGHRGRGIGPGLDWRGEGGYIIVPSPGSGYHWDPHWHLDTVPLQPVPATLLPREAKLPATPARPIRPTIGLGPYAEAALDSACRRIITAAAGEQEITLNGEAFAIGTLAGAGAIPFDFAHRALLWAARQIRDYDHSSLARGGDRAQGQPRLRGRDAPPAGEAPCVIGPGMRTPSCAPRPRASANVIGRLMAAPRIGVISSRLRHSILRLWTALRYHRADGSSLIGCQSGV
jgi:bifunctional DNA primase/polymerase-like protein